MSDAANSSISLFRLFFFVPFFLTLLWMIYSSACLVFKKHVRANAHKNWIVILKRSKVIKKNPFTDLVMCFITFNLRDNFYWHCLCLFINFWCFQLQAPQPFYTSILQYIFPVTCAKNCAFKIVVWIFCCNKIY